MSGLVEEARAYVTDDTTRIPTGFPAIDRAMRGGFRPGHVAMLVARTGVGKTAVAVQMTVNMVTAGFPAMFGSLEMTRPEVVVRALSAYTDLPLDDVEASLKSATPDPRLLQAMQDMRLWTCDDTNRPDWGDIERWVDRQEQKWRQRPAVVVIDHLKLMKRGYAKGEAERTQQLAEGAKTLAKQAGVALIVLHQVKRKSDDDTNHGHKRLTLEDMMYGGEADVDYAFGVFRPELDPDLDADKRKQFFGHTYLQLLKNRHGEPNLDGVLLKWRRPSMRFEDPSGRPTTSSPAQPDYLG